MTMLPTNSVVNASVGIKLILEEEHSRMVRAYFGRLAEEPSVVTHVPDLFFIECANIMWKKIRRGEVTLADSQAGLAWLNALMLPTTSTACVNERAVEIGSLFGISAYDGCYVALAEQLGVPLLTADNRLAAALADHCCPIITLDSVS